MKSTILISLAALSTAFVLPPDEQAFSQLAIEDHHTNGWAETVESTKEEIVAGFEGLIETGKKTWTDVYNSGKSVLDTEVEEVIETGKQTWNDVYQSSKSVLDDAFERASSAASSFGDGIEESAEELQSWWENSDLLGALEGHDGPDHDGPHHPPHHGPPGHGPPGHGPPGHGRPGHGKPKHPPHHHKSNLTVYQMIAGSKYTTKLAKLISDYPDLVEALNGTKANYTVFAPTDKAFEKIPEHAPKPSKEQLKAILSYHVVPDVYSAGRVLTTHTAPTLLKVKHLSSKKEPQRIAFKLGLRGLTVNFYSRIIAINIAGTNGIIHGVDSIILPPPSVATIVNLFPGEFSTLELGLTRTGLFDKLNSTDHPGGTLFAPSNFAFQKLGPRINAFLFSQYGQKYLKALLQYHVVPKNTLYSDAYYKADSDDKETSIPKGFFHVDLPTFLEDRKLSIDIARYGGFISMKINGFSTVAVQDGIAEDGVIHVVRDVLIPPKKLGESSKGELTVEELKERLEPFVAKMDL